MHRNVCTGCGSHPTTSENVARVDAPLVALFRGRGRAGPLSFAYALGRVTPCERTRGEPPFYAYDRT
eukprot:1155740-Pelagomonas_calceolata.AAC.8